MAGSMLAAGPAARADTIKTTGDCSPVVQNVGGDVSITCYVGQSKAPKFRIAYYRVGGVGLAFMLDGLLSPEWAKRLGGQQAIVDNAVAKEARRFLDRFATPVGGNYIYGQVSFEGGDFSGDFADYARKVDPSVEVMQTDGGPMPKLDPKRWRAYFGNGRWDKLFVPDLAAAETLLRGDRWPAGYGVVYGHLSRGPSRLNGKTVDPAPMLWRWLTEDDLDSFEERYKDYAKRVLAKALPNPQGAFGAGFKLEEMLSGWQAKEALQAVESIRYLTREGLPEHFLLVTGAPSGHEGWSFTATPRDFQLVVAVLQNIGDAAIDLGDFTVRETKAMTVRTNGMTNAALGAAAPFDRRLFPLGVLKPEEKLVIPVRIELAQSVPDSDYGEAIQEAARGGARLQARIAAMGKTKLAVADNGGQPALRKPAASFPPQRVPDIVERFEYGPAWRIDGVTVDGAVYPFRQHDPNNFVLVAGVGVGSCPYAFTFQPDAGIWYSEGHFLFGVTSPDRKRTEEKPLARFNGRVLIRELEHEITFLDRIELKLVDERGTATFHLPSTPALREIDGDEMALGYGEEAELDFGVTPADWRDKRASLVATGYYVPFSSVPLLAGSTGK